MILLITSCKTKQLRIINTRQQKSTRIMDRYRVHCNQHHFRNLAKFEGLKPNNTSSIENLFNKKLITANIKITSIYSSKPKQNRSRNKQGPMKYQFGARHNMASMPSTEISIIYFDASFKTKEGVCEWIYKCFQKRKRCVEKIGKNHRRKKVRDSGLEPETS